MALSTIGTAAIADDAITSAKVDSTTTAFTVADLVVTNGITAGTSINAGSELVGNVSGRILLDASASGTDVGDEFLLNATDASASNDGSKILFEEGTDDVSSLIHAGLPAGVSVNSGSLPTGSVVQVVTSGEILTSFTTASTSLVVITNCSVSITPRFANSKILVMVNLSGIYIYGGAGGSGDDGAQYSIFRDSTNVYGQGRVQYNRDTSSGSQELSTGIDLMFVDESPGAGPHLYALYARADSGSTIHAQTHSKTVTCMEIAG